MGGSELDGLVVEPLADAELHRGRGAVGHHVAPVFEDAAQNHDGGDRGEGDDHRVHRLTPEDLGQQPAEQGQAPDSHRRGDQADGHRARDAQPHAPGQAPQPKVEIHARTRFQSSPRPKGGRGDDDTDISIKSYDENS